MTSATALRFGLASLGLVCISTTEVFAQPSCPLLPRGGGSAVCGLVRSAAGNPVVGAQVRLESGGEALTDDDGRFVLLMSVPTPVSLLVRAIGYSPVVVTSTSETGTSGTLVVVLDPLVPVLDTVNVEGTRFTSTRSDFSGFADRRDQGAGYFMDESQMRSFAPTNVLDIFSAVPGLRVPTRGGSLLSIRGRDDRGRPCRPAIYLDGAYVPNIELITWIGPTEIIAVEVYHTRPPLMFRAPNTQGCTASVVLWTRLAKARR